MTFAKWVSYDTVLRAFFNEWEPSLKIVKNGRFYTVYHSKYPETDVNIVVIEDTRRRKDGYLRHEFFFRTFPGKHSSEEGATYEEIEAFHEELRRTISRKCRVPGRELENRLQQQVLIMEEKVGF